MGPVGKVLVVVLLLCSLVMAVRVCPNCGTENSDAARFCKSCGTRLVSPEPSQPARPRLVGQVSVSGTTVFITSEPSGATVTVDGRVRGTTPLELSDLSLGRHELLLTREGYREYSTSFTISTQTGTVVVTSDPVGAEIFVDGQSRGRAGEGGLVISRVQYGTRVITARLAGYEDVTKTIDLKSPGPVAVNFRLGWGKGFLSVRSQPSGGEVIVENRQLGVTPLLCELAPKRYLVTVARRGYFDWVGYADVQYAETVFVLAELERIKQRSPVLLGLGGLALAGTAAAAVLGEGQYSQYRAARDPAEVLRYRQATERWDMIRNVGIAATVVLAGSYVIFRF